MATRVDYTPLNVEDGERAPPPAAPRFEWSTCDKARIFIGTLLGAGAFGAGFYITQSNAVDFHPSPKAHLGGSVGLWGGLLSCLSVIVPANFTSRVHAASVICRRVLGVGIAAGGAALADTLAPPKNGTYEESTYYAFASFFAGLAVAFGPEAYRLTRR